MRQIVKHTEPETGLGLLRRMPEGLKKELKGTLNDHYGEC